GRDAGLPGPLRRGAAGHGTPFHRPRPRSVRIHPRARRGGEPPCPRSLPPDPRTRRRTPSRPGGGSRMSVKAALPEEIREVMSNGIPVVVATCSADGVPNVAIVSQVYYVDAGRVALSCQFFNKTTRNVRENPQASLILNDTAHQRRWVLRVDYDHSETEGPIFDEMDMTIEAVASATGMSGIFKVKSADLYRVLGVEILPT